MPSQILRPTVQDHICPLLERILQRWRRKCGIDDEMRAALVGLLRIRRDINGLACGVQRRLDMHNVAGL